MGTSFEKGNELEYAVRAIEHAILQSSPSLSKNTFLIESKKIVILYDVRHEIDIWVEIDHGNEYKSLFIFECKNWEDSVGKNEIIVFSEKIDAVRAQKGFFVAKSYTQDAKAQAAKDKRITLFYATEFPTHNLPTPFNFHFLLIVKKHGNLIAEERKIKQNKSFNHKQQIDLKTASSKKNDELFDLEKYVLEWIENIALKLQNTFPSAHKEEGIYTLENHEEREFNDNELLINDRNIEKLKLDVELTVRVVRPGVISHYEIESRGRILSLAPINMENNGYIQISFLNMPNN